jgi:signal transduction histidine kinase
VGNNIIVPEFFKKREGNILNKLLKILKNKLMIFKNKKIKNLLAEETKHRMEGERLLMQRNKSSEMGNIMDAIIHQWKHPLSTLFFVAGIVKDDLEKDEFNREELLSNVTLMLEQIQFMTDTVNMFQNFFKNKQDIERFDVAAAINDVLSMFSCILKQNSIDARFETNLEKDDLIVTGNPNEIQQIALNLLMNSKDAILNRRKNLNNQILEGLVTIEIKKEERNLNIIFTDNGGGMPKNVISHIFDPYFTTKNIDGTGIGLYISKQIISKYKNGGMIARNTENGAQFVISIGL